jgi:hypothetical protein
MTNWRRSYETVCFFMHQSKVYGIGSVSAKSTVYIPRFARFQKESITNLLNMTGVIQDSSVRSLLLLRWVCPSPTIHYSHILDYQIGASLGSPKAFSRVSFQRRDVLVKRFADLLSYHINRIVKVVLFGYLRI